ncbi:MAG: chemotaxis protein CheW [Thermoplasmata archaeon]|jgi:purine-binding chemotaxis protein CheW
MLDTESAQYVVFRLGKEEYGFDVRVVREINNMEEVAKVHRSASHIEGVINLRGKLLTVVNLRKRFGMEPNPATEGNQRIVVVDAADAPVGFLVDEVMEVARFPKESVEKAPPYIASGIEAQYVIGIAKHEERLITLIDPLKVLELSCDVEDGSGGS